MPGIDRGVIRPLVWRLMPPRTTELLVAAVLAAPGLVLGHGKAPHADTAVGVVQEQKDWGIAGDAKAVRRTIAIGMTDRMRFTPEHIEVRQGETVRFIVSNRGRLKHEFVIGTRAENDAHAALMLKFPDMAHDEPYMAHVDPGQRGQIVWTFNRSGEFEFACLIAGHYQAGMVGRITVLATSTSSPSSSKTPQSR